MAHWNPVMKLSSQFTIRALLFVMTVAAACLWWPTLPPKGNVTIKQTSRVRPGMTEADVCAILGSPAKDEGTTWEFTLVGPTPDENLRRFRVTFKDGRAIRVLHANKDYPWTFNHGYLAR